MPGQPSSSIMAAREVKDGGEIACYCNTHDGLDFTQPPTMLILSGAVCRNKRSKADGARQSAERLPAKFLDNFSYVLIISKYSRHQKPYMTLKDTQRKIRSGDYTFSDHAVKRMMKRDILRREVEDAVFQGEIIEEYPDDKYSPSCLVYGKTKNGRDLHVQVSFPPSVVIITVYEPDPKEWVNCRMRRQ